MSFTDRARALRKIQTSAESIFWEKVRNGKTGLKFVRQKPLIYNHDGNKRVFFADFYCREKKVIIELDGKIHESQQDYDNLRDNMLKDKGYHVIRIRNEELLDNFQTLLNKINEL